MWPFVLCFLLVIFNLSAGEPVEMPPSIAASAARLTAAIDRAEAAYAKAVQDAAKAHDRDLLAAEQTATKAGNLDLALAIRAKREEVKPFIEGEPLPSGKVSPSRGGGSASTRKGRVEVEAAKAGGTLVTAVKAGDKIALRYVEGRWSHMRGFAPYSPDDIGTRMQASIGMRVGGAVEYCGVVNTGTAEKPHIFTAPKDGEMVLFMEPDQHVWDNTGRVVYLWELQK